MATVLVTGSCGLIGSEVSLFFARQGFQVHGIDDNHRAIFFGREGDTSWVLQRTDLGLVRGEDFWGPSSAYRRRVGPAAMHR